MYISGSEIVSLTTTGFIFMRGLLDQALQMRMPSPTVTKSGKSKLRVVYSDSKICFLDGRVLLRDHLSHFVDV
jgi:hypothetical protein